MSKFVWKAARRHVDGLPDCPLDLSKLQYANLMLCARCHVCVNGCNCLEALRCDTGLRKSGYSNALDAAPQVLSELQNPAVWFRGSLDIIFGLLVPLGFANFLPAKRFSGMPW